MPIRPMQVKISLGVGAGWDWAVIRGSGLLFLTNLVAIILSSFLIFSSMNMDIAKVSSRITDWQRENEKLDHFYAVIEMTSLRRLLGKVGTLPRRVLILLAFLALVSYPLQRSLIRLSHEAYIRRAVLAELSKLIPRDSVVQEDLEIDPERVHVRVANVGLHCPADIGRAGAMIPRFRNFVIHKGRLGPAGVPRSFAKNGTFRLVWGFENNVRLLTYPKGFRAFRFGLRTA